MRKYLLPAALAMSALPAPALAIDHNVYVGIEGGAWLVNVIKADTDGFDFPFPFPGPLSVSVPSDTGINAALKTGYDIDAVAGYDWGYVRTELELGIKHAKFDRVAIGEANIFAGEHDAYGYINSFSLMANVLADVPLGHGFNITAGPGLGWGQLRVHAQVDTHDTGTSTAKLDDELESGMIWQLTGGVRKQVSNRAEVGLKYRYVNTGKRKFDTGIYGDAEGKLQAHSVLVSLIYNFGPGAR